MISRLMPSRTAHQDSVKVICDFDSLLNADVGFKFQGKTHKLNPIDVKNFMQVTVAYRSLLEMLSKRSEGSDLTEQDIFQAYFDLIHPIAPTISFAEMRGMNLVMLNNLVNLVFRQIAGDPSLYETESAEKKNPLIR